MTTALEISVLRFVRAPGAIQQRGVLGWVQLRVAGLHVDAVAVRQTRDGRRVLSFPERRGRSIIWPENDDARRAIEAQVIGELRRRGHLS